MGSFLILTCPYMRAHSRLQHLVKGVLSNPLHLGRAEMEHLH